MRAPRTKAVRACVYGRARAWACVYGRTRAWAGAYVVGRRMGWCVWASVGAWAGAYVRRWARARTHQRVLLALGDGLDNVVAGGCEVEVGARRTGRDNLAEAAPPSRQIAVGHEPLDRLERGR
eukprot:2688346-Prymnesium_polylepis.1